MLLKEEITKNNPYNHIKSEITRKLRIKIRIKLIKTRTKVLLFLKNITLRSDI